MSHWRSGTFWASAIFGWFVSQCVLALFVAVFVYEETSESVGVAAFAALVVFPLFAGYGHGKQQFRLQERKTRGFPVITNDE